MTSPNICSNKINKIKFKKMIFLNSNLTLQKSEIKQYLNTRLKTDV